MTEPGADDRTALDDRVGLDGDSLAKRHIRRDDSGGMNARRICYRGGREFLECLSESERGIGDPDQGRAQSPRRNPAERKLPRPAIA